MARETLFETQALSFVLSDFGYMYQTTPSPFVLTAGESYIIVWEGQEYVRTAWAFDSLAPGTVGVGSTLPAGGEADPDGLPVTFGYIPATDYAAIFSLEGEGPYSVGLYKEIAEPARLILRDPDGTEQEYPMRPMLEVDTTEGGTVLYSKGQILDGLTIQPDFSAGDMEITAPDGYLVQSAVIAKPEDCEPENILKDKTIGNIVGTLELPELVATTIDPDFSAGDMVVTPDAGKAFSGVTVTKPANLVPENIAKDVDVAGVVGTHEGGGGGGNTPCVLRSVYVSASRQVTSSTSLYIHCQVRLPLQSTIIDIAVGEHGIYTSSTTIGQSVYFSSFNSNTFKNPSNYTIKINDYETDKRVSIAYSIVINNTAKQKLGIGGLVVLFTIPGLYYTTNVDGTIDLFADNSLVALPMYDAMPNLANNIDLSNSSITSIPTECFRSASCKNLILPSTITTIEANGLKGILEDSNATIDFSRATAVPTKADTVTAAATVLVPAALYSQWTSATNWSGNIVAV